MTYLVVAGNAVDGLTYVAKDTLDGVAEYLRPLVTEFVLGEDVEEPMDVVDVLYVAGDTATLVGFVTKQFTETTNFTCAECGSEFGQDENEVSYHLTDDGDIDYDADADHAAYGEPEFSYVFTLTVQPHGEQTNVKTITLR